IVRRVVLVELVPQYQARFLEHVVGVGPVGQQRQDVGVQAALVLQEQAQKQLALRLLGRVLARGSAAVRAALGTAGHGRVCLRLGGARGGPDAFTPPWAFSIYKLTGGQVFGRRSGRESRSTARPVRREPVDRVWSASDRPDEITARFSGA